MASSNSHPHRSAVSGLIGRGDYTEGYFFSRVILSLLRQKGGGGAASPAPSPRYPTSGPGVRPDGGKGQQGEKKKIPSGEGGWQACVCPRIPAVVLPLPSGRNSDCQRQSAKEKSRCGRRHCVTGRVLGGGTGRDTPFLAARVPPEAPRGLFPGSDAPSFLPRASRSPGATDTGPSRLVWETSLTESHSC